MNSKIYDIAVVGGGASGMTAAITAARLGARVALLEKNDLPGKKLLATGNGRCNFTNADLSDNHFYSDEKERLVPLLSVFDTGAAVDFLRSLGVVGRVYKDGGYYPQSNRAKDVRACFQTALRQTGVTVFCDTEIRDIKYEDGCFFLTPSAGEPISAKCCILSTGGMAAPKSGSTGDGYRFAKAFGHSVITPHPALTGLLCEKKVLRKLAGLRARAMVSFECDGALVRREYGEVQFNKDGLSGIPVMSLSRFATDERNANKPMQLSLNVLPQGLSEDEEQELLSELLYVNGWGKSVREALEGLLATELLQVILSEAGLSEDSAAEEVTKPELLRLHKGFRSLIFPVTGAKGFDAAQTTAGGVSLSEVDGLTFASKKRSGLYLCGELLDADGVCGGYNLHFAWASGQAAGSAAAKEACG